MKPQEKLRLLLPMEEIEQGAQTQIWEAAALPFVETLAIMPDVHQGYSLPIGGVALLKGVISPGYVGYDIGCGMCHRPIAGILPQEMTEGLLRTLYQRLAAAIPHGLGQMHAKPTMSFGWKSACGDKKLSKALDQHMSIQVGTLGAGNHFIEVGTNVDNTKVGITIHSGSRGVGYKLAEHYMAAARREDKNYPNDFLDLDSDWGKYYLEDMNYMLKFALINRMWMLNLAEAELCKLVGCGYTKGLEDPEKARSMALTTGKLERSTINENHNHAVPYKGGMLHRKGATPAEEGQLGVIPGDMSTGVFITKGLGNEEYLCSASHGAGRVLSRSKAKKTLSIDVMKDLMAGIVSTVSEVGADDVLDEHPHAYKDVQVVINRQEGVVIDVVDRYMPVLNLKG